MAEQNSKTKTKAPESVTLASHYGFIDEAGKAWTWLEGQVVTEAEIIQTLIERKAPIK